MLVTYFEILKGSKKRKNIPNFVKFLLLFVLSGAPGSVNSIHKVFLMNISIQFGVFADFDPKRYDDHPHPLI